MIYETFSEQNARDPVTETVLSICPGGVLEATVILPPVPAAKPPLLALHGISRNATEMVAGFSGAVSCSGRILVVPHFSAQTWPVFQRITRRARPDRALLNLLATLRNLSPAFDGPVDVFGFSGGAQLAHRFAMLYPERVGALHLGAAGWYTLPDTSCSYPYGIADADNAQPWARRMRSGLRAYLAREIRVYVGEHDLERDSSLRRSAQLDDLQGRNRVERARNYVARINAQQTALGLIPTARFCLLQDCAHSFFDCMSHGALAQRVCDTLASR